MLLFTILPLPSVLSLVPVFPLFDLDSICILSSLVLCFSLSLTIQEMAAMLQLHEELDGIFDHLRQLPRDSRTSRDLSSSFHVSPTSEGERGETKVLESDPAAPRGMGEEGGSGSGPPSPAAPGVFQHSSPLPVEEQRRSRAAQKPSPILTASPPPAIDSPTLSLLSPDSAALSRLHHTTKSLRSQVGVMNDVFDGIFPPFLPYLLAYLKLLVALLLAISSSLFFFPVCLLIRFLLVAVLFHEEQLKNCSIA